jgi:hypothetical protein
VSGSWPPFGQRGCRRYVLVALPAVLVEQADHGLVVDLLEGYVVAPDREEVLERVQANHLVGFPADRPLAFGRRHRHCCDDTRGSCCSRPAQRRDHRRAGGEPVVDDEHGLGADVEHRVLGVKPLVEQRCFRLGLLDDVRELHLGEPVGRAYVDVGAGGDRSDPRGVQKRGRVAYEGR